MTLSRQATDAAEHFATTMPERGREGLQANVEAALRDYGWLWYHTHRSDRSPAGFPDIVACRGDRLIFAELKREQRSKLTGEQERWRTALVMAGAQYYMWRPSDLLAGRIDEVLRW